MAAVIELRTGRDLSDPTTSRARQAEPSPTPLRVIHGGRSLAARRMRRTFLLRRLAVVAAAVLFVWAGVQVVSAAATPLPAAGAPVELGAVHRVAPGDTLWALAASVDPDADPRDVVDDIVSLNAPGTPGSALDAELRLLAGRELRLPIDS
jgi:hypothetical protein